MNSSTNDKIKHWICSCGRLQKKPFFEKELWECNKCKKIINIRVINFHEVFSANYLKRLLRKETDLSWKKDVELEKFGLDESGNCFNTSKLTAFSKAFYFDQEHQNLIEKVEASENNDILKGKSINKELDNKNLKQDENKNNILFWVTIIGLLLLFTYCNKPKYNGYDNPNWNDNRGDRLIHEPR